MFDPEWCSSNSQISPVVDVSALMSLESTTYDTYWASAARSSPTVPSFAVGTCHGILLVEATPETWIQNRHTDFSDYEASDTLAVDWLDQNVVLSGCRNGEIRLWDTRHNGTSARMVHPSSTTHVRRMNEHMIVAAGLMHQVSPQTLSGHMFFPQPRHPCNTCLLLVQQVVDVVCSQRRHYFSSYLPLAIRKP